MGIARETQKRSLADDIIDVLIILQLDPVVYFFSAVRGSDRGRGFVNRI